MPLQDEFPVIDDRTFAQIVDEAKARIPRYAPEWTDFNEGDPGMALVELFAWMTEMLIYRLGKVPQLNYLKFLELVGIELTPAQPAAAEITFPLKEGSEEAYVIVPTGTQVSTEEPDEDGRPIVFETDRALIALAASLGAVQSYDGYAYKDLSQANEAAEAFEPLGARPREGSALLLGFASDLPFPAVEVDLAFWTSSSSGTAAVTCGESVAASSSLEWEYWDGKEWRILTLLKDDTGVFARSGHVRLQAPAEGKMVKATLGKKTDQARYWIRARVTAADFESAPALSAVRGNTVSATQAETIEYEVLGGSNGRPDQTFALKSAPVLEGSLTLQVDETGEFEDWEEVADFYGSGKEDAHYVLNRSTGEVRFGDGANGRIPVANPRRQANIRALKYRVGGGGRGNAAAGAINSPLDSLEGVDSGAVANLFEAGGGTEEETVEEAKERAPVTLKSRDRAVTPEDFELLAKKYSNVARAKALPLHHPEFPGVEVPGVITVIVVPDAEDDAPMPAESTLKAVCACLDERRLLTTEVYVAPPEYAVIRVSANLVAREDADLAEIQIAAAEAIETYFHPLRGGDDGLGWEFGGDVYYAQVMHKLMVEGVRRVKDLTIEIDGKQAPACQDVCLKAGMLLANGEHDIRTQYEYEEG